jgi:hypothetical protein
LTDSEGRISRQVSLTASILAIFKGLFMSLAALRRPAAAEGATAGGSSLLGSPLALAVLALILSAAKFWPTAASVWTTGAYGNTDDAMRLVEVRDWLAGQAWFDLHQYRLDPPDGVFMHWTRVLDVPIAILIKGFSFVLPIEQAEKLTRIVLPLSLLFALFYAVISLARRVAGPSAMLPAAMMTVLAGAVFGQFEPGRIHHHTPQILLVVLILRATIDAVATASASRAALAAALAALSLSINVEDITYIFVEVAAFALVFVVRGEAFRRALASFAAALAASSLAVFLATIGPQRYFVAACDAFSVAHLFAIFVGGAVLIAMAASVPLLRSWPQRLAAAAFGGAVVVGAMAFAYPACLHDPLAAVDPLLRQYWLSQVEEARPLTTMILAKPSDFFIFMLAPLLGLAAAIFVAWRQQGEERVIWLIVAAFAGIGFATSLWQVRAIASTSVLALFGGAFVAGRAMEWAHRQENILAKLSPIPIILCFCSAFWGILAVALTPSSVEAKTGSKDCRDPASIRAALDPLPKSLLMNPIDMGSDILADTDHSVLAGPYHRNNHGNGVMVRAMLAKPDEAKKIVEGSGANYLVFCRMPEFDSYTEGSSDGLAAALVAGRAPDWLAPVTTPQASPLAIYKIR